MPRLSFVLVFLLVLAAPAAGQAVPDDIPDDPDEALADRVEERFVERHRSFLSRFFSTSTLDAAPLQPDGPAVQANASLGFSFRSGDAVFLSISSRLNPTIPTRESEAWTPVVDTWLWYAGAGYTFSGARLSETSEAAARSALSVELGMGSGVASLVVLDVSPTYEVFRRGAWSIPAGVRLSLARFDGPDGAVVHPFVGLTLGAKFNFFSRDRLEHRTESH